MPKLENRNTSNLLENNEGYIRAKFYLDDGLEEEANSARKVEDIPKLYTSNPAEVASKFVKDKNLLANESKNAVNKESVLKEICNISNKHTLNGNSKNIVDNFNKAEINRKVKSEHYIKDTENGQISNAHITDTDDTTNSVEILNDIPKLVKRSTDDAESETSTKHYDNDTAKDKDIRKESDSDSDHNNNDVSEADNAKMAKNTSDIHIKVTMAVTDSSLEDEEVKTIMESCDELDQQVRQKTKHTKRLRKPRKYEEIKTRRKRSKSFDNSSLQCAQNFDFTKYGISVGSGIPHDLLPGIEDYLCNVLANESLSEYAEEQRQYFLERLDIIKLPPSVPPRPQSLGVRLYPAHSSPPLSNRDSIQSLEHEDFAAYQRELSRALLGEYDSTPNISEVKVYDDIDTTDGSLGEVKTSNIEEEESMYEIPQLQRTLSDSGYEKALELSPMSKSTSSDEQLSGQSGTPMPPPLPPRGERTLSDAASRSSIGSMLEERMSDIPVFRSKLNRESSVPDRLEKAVDSRSERSSDDLLDEEYDGASCDSLDEVGTLIQNQDPDLRIKLPRQVKRKHRSHHRNLGKSLSSLWEITQPFSMLEDVVMSGELHYRSKLTWTRKIVALTNGRLVCYKVDKTDSRPAFVILLMGYIATFHKREGRRSFEIHLNHENFESYIFLVDFKEWAEIWCEHINAAAKGQRAPGPFVHLARSSMMANHDGTYHMPNISITRSVVGETYSQLSNSNASLVSSDGFEAEPGTIKVKKRDQSGTKTAKMGTFAFKATQFFESLSKKSSVKKTPSTSSERTPSVERIRQSSGSQSSLGEMSEKLSPMTPDSHIEESPLESPLEMKKHIKHQGYVDVYSSFNKRKWGKRWCLVHENNFECYRTQTSEVCELEFLLRNCILRRAIEETKSELGLMLLENDREKITIEPINWTELGSWLRILMQETSTPATPKGLEGYMDDTHPYHEAVEITRVPDQVQRQNMLSVTSKGGPVINPADSRSKHGSSENRDSGICSSESTDDRFNSLERSLNSPTVHPCFTDSSLPRVSVSETGAIYTQVKKATGTSSNFSTATGSRNNDSQSNGSLKTNSMLGYKYDSDKSNTVRKSDDDDDKLFFDFDIAPFNEPAFKRESSLVDEIMSELMIQQTTNMHTDDEIVDKMNEVNNSQTDLNYTSKRKSNEFHAIENELSPIKSEDVTMTVNDSDFLCSSFLEHNDKEDSIGALSFNCDYKVVTGEHETKAKVTSNNVKEPVALRRHPSNVSAKEVTNVHDALVELRTRLVQLKKDRISIRDRKQRITSETDREFLEAEYERLNRECQKVTDEIKTTEQSTLTVSEIDSNKSNDKTVKKVNSKLNETDHDASSEKRTKENNQCPSEEKEIIITLDETSENAENIEEPLNFENIERNENQEKRSSRVEEKLENQMKENDAPNEDKTDTKCDNAHDFQCNSHFPPNDTQQSVQSRNKDGSLNDNQCNNESNIVCDTEIVPKTSNLVDNTQKQTETVKTTDADEQDADSNIAGSNSTDYVIDKLSKDFENKLFLKEN